MREPLLFFVPEKPATCTCEALPVVTVQPANNGRLAVNLRQNPECPDHGGLTIPPPGPHPA